MSVHQQRQRDPHPLPVFTPDATLLDAELQVYRDECLAPCLDALDVPEHFARLPNDVARWGRIYSNAIAHAAAVEAHYRREAGELWADFTDKYMALKGKAPDKLVENTVRADQAYVNAKSELGRAEGLVAEVREVLNALRRKGDALVSLGAQRRTEYEAQRLADTDRT